MFIAHPAFAPAVPSAAAARVAYRGGHAVGSFGMGVVHGFTGVHPLSQLDRRSQGERRGGYSGPDRRVAGRTAERRDGGPERRDASRAPQTYAAGPLQPERVWDIGGETTRTAQAVSGAGEHAAAFGQRALAGPPDRGQARASFPMAQDGSKPTFPSGDPYFAMRGGLVPMRNAEGAVKAWRM